jgi:hypothetical protein
MLVKDMTNVKVIGNDWDGYRITRLEQNYHNAKRLGPPDPFATQEDAIKWCRQVQYQVRVIIDTNRLESI